MTRDELASLIGKGLTFLRILPLPSDSIDAGDRLQIAGFYRGFASDTPVVLNMPGCVVLTHAATRLTDMTNALVTTVTMESEPCG